MPILIALRLQPYSAEPLFAAALDVDSVSFDGVQTLNIGSQSTGAGAGKVAFGPLTIARRYDARSPGLWAKMCSGTPFQKAQLTFTLPAQTTPYLAVGYSLLAVKTIHVEADASGQDVKEVLTFEYGAATFTSVVQNADGSFGAPVTFGWDRVRNIAVNTPIVLDK